MERIGATYHVKASKDEIANRAKGIALEQTVELPESLVPNGFIRDEIVGKITDISPINDNLWCVNISYHQECAGDDLPQLLNVIFGNTSLQNDVQLRDFKLPSTLLKRFKGPRFGCKGLRNLLNVEANKPLVQTALKPMGKSANELALLAHQFALGGVDIIKDDHGLSNQCWAPFEKRVEACVAAVNKANEITGKRSLYAPNICASFDKILYKAKFAKEAGAGALMISPGLVGLDAMRYIAEDDNIGLPVIAHPAFFGGNVISLGAGISHRIMFGLLPRLCGADSSVYPNYGGRFGFSREQCLEIVNGCTESLGHMPSIFPTPGGGMTFERITDMQNCYGNEVMYLIGGGLYGLSPDLTQSVHQFMQALGR